MLISSFLTHYGLHNANGAFGSKLRNLVMRKFQQKINLLLMTVSFKKNELVPGTWFRVMF